MMHVLINRSSDRYYIDGIEREHRLTRAVRSAYRYLEFGFSNHQS